MRRDLHALSSKLLEQGDSDLARQVNAGNLHLTLVFIGWVEAHTANDLVSWLGDFQAPQFSLRLDDIGHFGKSDVVWAGPSATSAPLLDLVSAVTARATELGIDTDDGRAYRPHVSLVRNLSLPSTEFGKQTDDSLINQTLNWPIVWSVDQCVLMRAIDTPSGARYDIAARSRRN